MTDMKLKRIFICGILAGALLAGMCGCAKGDEQGKAEGTKAELSAETENEVENEVENEQTSFRTTQEYKPDETAVDKETEAGESETEKSDAVFQKEEEGFELVGINAHVKEIHGDTLLISSDSDDYPGAFIVTDADEMSEFPDLQGGTAIQIVMRKLGETDGQGLMKYQAERMVILSGEEAEAQEDILLTEVPVFSLQDVLSSTMNFTELRSGNYSWNVEDGDEGTGVIACGAAPLDEASMDFTVRLKVPEYNGMSGAPYMFSTKVAPDTLVVSQWNADDIGSAQAEEEKVTKYYFKSPILELEAGKVYEFALEWKKENAGRNKFYGYASYVLVTE